LLVCEWALEYSSSEGHRPFDDDVVSATRFHVDLCDVNRETVQGWCRDYSRAKAVLVTGGPPCQGASGLNASRLGAVGDPRSALRVEFKELFVLAQECFSWCPVFFFQESVSSMDKEDLNVYSQVAEIVPFQVCASAVSPVRRDRMYWVSWKMWEVPGLQIEEGEDYHKLTLTVPVPPLSCFLKDGSSKVQPLTPFPTFTRSIPKSKPGFAPAGLRNCDEATQQRWMQDDYRYPPYIYQEKHLVVQDHKLRLPDVEEKELMMGFPPKYTAACVPKSNRRGQSWLDARNSLIGNTWSVPIIMCFFSQLCSQLGLSDWLNVQQVMELRWRDVAPGEATLRASNSYRQPSLELVKRLLLCSSFKGSDVKLTPDSLDSPSIWPRKPVPSNLWLWKTIGSWRFSHTFGKEHINVLEMRAFLHALQWRLRNPHNVRTRFFHLLDSQVCLGILAKGRTASRKMTPVMRRVSALLLVSGCVAFSGWVQTECNPADKPSRRVIKLKRWRRKK
jgi:site-specific DNA-cytosine methylase